MDLSFLPTVNAALNATAAVLLVRGRAAIRRGDVATHRRRMLSAFGVSALFLVLYSVHKVWRGFVNTHYPGHGLARHVYLTILATHVTLAMTVPVFAVLLVRFGLRGEIARHRRLARVAWPIWIYVSITGVVVYAMLYGPGGVHPAG